MKSVLISIRPEWVEKIVSGKKTIEVRKSAPKEVPFKAYIYCSYGDMKTNYYLRGRGKVIGEFICDKIDEYKFHNGLIKFNSMGLPSGVYGSYLIFEDDYKSMCLSYDEVKNYGKDKTLYGWHISQLKIYNKPKELREFYKPCPDPFNYCTICKHCIRIIPPDEEEYALYHGGQFDYWEEHCMNNLTRPPQSWCYVQAMEE